MKKVNLLTKGTIIKGIGGFYYVKPHEQNIKSSEKAPPIVPREPGAAVECKARGLFRKDGQTPIIGDEVYIEIQKDGTGYIKEILPRSNAFIRPPVANIEQFMIVAALAEPEPSLGVLDKFMVAAEKEEVEIRLVFNKSDLGDDRTKQMLQAIYEPIYPVYFVCGKSGAGTEPLKDALVGKKTAFAGPSGVGKSTLINLLTREAGMQTGKVSEKTKRGKHTTRHVELVETDFGAMLYDTPGFSSFEMADIEKEELELFFPEIEKRRAGCRFKGCSHISEPDCAVKEALLAGRISQSRYDSYISQYTVLQETKKW